MVFLVYWDALVWYEHDRSVFRSIPETAGIFATYPSPHLSIAGGVFDQFLATLLLLLCICAITDRRNMKLDKQMVPVGVGITVLGIGISLGHNSGYAVNPARDLGPRVFTWLAGWGPGVFTEYNHWWLVPVIACHVGAIAGAWLYYLAVELNWPEETEDLEKAGRRVGNGVERSAVLYPPHPQNNIQQPPENPGYNGTLTRGDSRPHTPDEVRDCTELRSIFKTFSRRNINPSSPRLQRLDFSTDRGEEVRSLFTDVNCSVFYSYNVPVLVNSDQRDQSVVQNIQVCPGCQTKVSEVNLHFRVQSQVSSLERRSRSRQSRQSCQTRRILTSPPCPPHLLQTSTSFLQLKWSS